MRRKKRIKPKKIVKTETTHQGAVKRAGPLPNGGPDKSWEDFKNEKDRL